MDCDQKIACQKEFSSYLNLLRAINYEDPAHRWSNADDRDGPTKSPLRVLETIALCMATGQPGEVVASTFLIVPERKSILLSKNADPEPQDITDSKALIERMQMPRSRTMQDILPFLAHRHAEFANKRLKKLSQLMEAGRGDLLKYIGTYAGNAPVRLEFPQVGEDFFLHYRDHSKTSDVKEILEDIVDTCAARVTFVNNHSSFKGFSSIVTAATALGKSRFFKYYINAKKIVKTDDTQYAKLWRNLDKVHQYIRISDAIDYMQQNGPFTVKWVTKAQLKEAACFESEDISLCSVWDTITKINGSNKKSNTKQSFNKDDVLAHFKNKERSWKKKPGPASTTLHAELRLIVFLEIQAGSRATKSTPSQHPIGCSKRSCLACTWTMQEINKLTKVRDTYLTAGSHTGIYRTCARIGPIPEIDPHGKCGERVLKRLANAARDKLDEVAGLSGPLSDGVKPGHRHKHSEEYVSSSDPEGEELQQEQNQSLDNFLNQHEPDSSEIIGHCRQRSNGDPEGNARRVRHRLEEEMEHGPLQHPLESLSDELVTLELNSNLNDLRIAAQFIEGLQTATLEKSNMSVEDIEHLREAPSSSFDGINDQHFLKALRTFLATTNASERTYDDVRAAHQDCYSNDPYLSYYQVQRRVKLITGVTQIMHDMCIGSCVGFTGPFDLLNACPECSEPRYHTGTRKPHHQCPTVPIGSVIQALYRSENTAKLMHYLDKFVEKLLKHAQKNRGEIQEYSDTACGRDFLNAWMAKTFKKGDILLQLSINGAQLYCDKESDCWIFIWIIHNLSPDLRYKKRFVIPGGFFGGPGKPKHTDSVIHPALYHVSALQKEGLRINKFIH
ncbi:hypothetical protein C0992_007238 [Termitomyces sp. T32_za158]|nr:hypothetical protein C0992_007238 [Termitomyces sp. T32_za158]